MDILLIAYATYVALSLVLVAGIGGILNKNGLVFLEDVSHGKSSLASSMNQLLLLGFYLVNVGYVLIRIGDIAYAREFYWNIVSTLSQKFGILAVLLGATHLFNLFILSRLRSTSPNQSNPSTH